MLKSPCNESSLETFGHLCAKLLGLTALGL